MQFLYDPRLDGLLSSIEATLIAEIPPAVRRLAVAEPAYSLFLWYNDSASTDFTPRFGVGNRIGPECLLAAICFGPRFTD